MKHYTYNQLSREQLQALYKRPKMDFQSVFGKVEPIIDRVHQEGDEAVQHFTRHFDGVKPSPLVVNPQQQEVSLDAKIQEAIDVAFDNISQFHKAQITSPLQMDTMPGVHCERVARPIQRVGLYVPGGTATLPSTLMMLGIPAMLAGCSTIVVATPPTPEGGISKEIHYIAKKIGARYLLKAGGAQAIAGMAWGTDSIPKVDKIFGPGNQYVTAAKMLLQNSEAQVAIDMPAGPSEVLVVADASSNPDFVAADLLSQAEHGRDSQVVLVATNDFKIRQCLQSLKQQQRQLPRKEVARQAMEKSFRVTVESVEEAFAFSNAYAPEHLIVQCQDAQQWKEHIYNAGSVFLGDWTPESAGDYASGTNHTLPTYGYARMYGGVALDSFQKYLTMQTITAEGLRKLGPTVEKLAALEELQAHKKAVSIRLTKLQQNLSNDND